MESTYKLVPVPIAAGVARNRIYHMQWSALCTGHVLQRRDGSSSCAYPERAQGSHDLKLGRCLAWVPNCSVLRLFDTGGFISSARK